MGISIYPPAKGGDNWVQIATSTPTSGSVVTFSSIAQSYEKLMVMIVGQSATFSGVVTQCYFTINGATSGYSYGMSNITGNTFTAAINNASINFPRTIPAFADITGFLTIESANAATVKRISGGLINATATSFACWFDNGFSRQTAFVSTIAFTLGSGTFTSGTTFTLYGVAA
jgi:hypothetical protein